MKKENGENFAVSFNKMINFTKLDKNVLELKKYFIESDNKVCDNSVGTKYLWRNAYNCEFAIFNDTLIIKEKCEEYSQAFYYPMGKDIDGAILEIENYCKENNILPRFVWLDNYHTADICKRFYKTEVFKDRAWSDYIYDAESFKSLVGKKYSGQRNHINKFKKSYPNYEIKDIEEQDLPLIKEMLLSYEEEHSFTEKTAIVEDKSLIDFLDNTFYLQQQGLMIKVDSKCVAFSVGEVVADTLIIHVEKALVEYAGIYPFLANEYAKRYAVGGVKYINREEDCGDMGLRTSKIQYQPIEIKDKNTVVVKSIFPSKKKPIEIKTERLVLTDIREQDKEEYFNIYIDDNLNKFWGYDYREDLGKRPLTKEYFYEFQKELKVKKEEYSLAVLLDDKMIGEVVLHNFDFHGGVEIGFRIKTEYQKKGYAYESVIALMDYVYSELKIQLIKGKCFKENKESFNLFIKLGFSKTHQDETYFYFLKKKF